MSIYSSVGIAEHNLSENFGSVFFKHIFNLSISSHTLLLAYK